MVTQIKKRDGRIEPFNRQKIIDAIHKAYIDGEFYDPAISERIASAVELNANEILEVEQIQDLVEQALVAERLAAVAKRYILYRDARTRERNERTALGRRVSEVLECASVENSNANVDEYSFGGRKFEAANAMHRDLALSKYMSPEVAQAHKAHQIYIHDLSEWNIGTHNCLFVDLQRLLANGFATRNGDVRPANSFSTACQLVAVIFQCQSQMQFGGVASAHIDYDLAPYVRKSFTKHLKDGLRWMEVFSPKEKLNEASPGDTHLKEQIPQAWAYAMEMLGREGRQAAQGLYHNLNTLESRAGSQLPFSSINFGTDTSPEGRLVTKWLLEASVAGIGKHNTTPIFPISVFKYKHGVNDKPGTPNYDLRLLSEQSLCRRIYPNIVNCNWSQNQEEPGNPDTELATMGCVERNSIVTYKLGDKTFVCGIGEMFERLSRRSVYDSRRFGKGEYIVTKRRNVEIYDTLSGGFVECKGVIRNKNVSDWYEIKFADGNQLVATGDHPLPIVFRGRTFVRDIKVGDYVFSAKILDEDKDIPLLKITSITKLHFCDDSFDVETESDTFDVSGICSHNCRTMLGFDRHGLGYSKVGRGNACPVTVNLPRIALRHGIVGERDGQQADVNGFWEELQEVLRLAEKALLERYDRISSQSARCAPFMYKNGTIAGFDGVDDYNVASAIKHCTLALGYIGIAEMCQALFGKNHAEDPAVRVFALSVVRHIHDFCLEASQKHDLNFSCYATPAESLCHTFAKANRQEFGEIKNVTDRDYITNSHHVPVWMQVTPMQKLELEAPFCKYAKGGCITYVELEGSVMKNPEAVRAIADAAMELDIPYLAFNFPIDTCADCGYSGEIDDACPVCGSQKITRLRRVTGYITVDYMNFNDGKIAECNDRAKHHGQIMMGQDGQPGWLQV